MPLQRAVEGALEEGAARAYGRSREQQAYLAAVAEVEEEAEAEKLRREIFETLVFAFIMCWHVRSTHAGVRTFSRRWSTRKTAAV